MRYWEGQVDYYGKIGMSLLVFMEIMWKVDEEVSAFEYFFVYYVIKGYSGQDYVQMAAAIQLAVDALQDCHPSTKNVILQSDNIIVFAPQELIPLIFNMNT